MKYLKLRYFSLTFAPVFMVSIFSCQLPQAATLKTSTNSVFSQSLLTKAQPSLTDSSVVPEEQQSTMKIKEKIKENSSSSNSQTLTNGEWTIKIDNLDSWSGVNGTGNLEYYGCDSRGSCLSLTGGQMSCREGICTMAWRNGEYHYIIEQPMDDPDHPIKSVARESVLIVDQGGKIILRVTGLK